MPNSQCRLCGCNEAFVPLAGRFVCGRCACSVITGAEALRRRDADLLRRAGEEIAAGRGPRVRPLIAGGHVTLAG